MQKKTILVSILAIFLLLIEVDGRRKKKQNEMDEEDFEQLFVPSKSAAGDYAMGGDLEDDEDVGVYEFKIVDEPYKIAGLRWSHG